jgi:hypothetical protein
VAFPDYLAIQEMVKGKPIGISPLHWARKNDIGQIDMVRVRARALAGP